MSALNPDVTVIAGVGPGLGAALARKFAHEGCRIARLARSSDFIGALSDEFRRTGTPTLAIPADLGETDQLHGVSGGFVSSLAQSICSSIMPVPVALLGKG